MKLGIETEINSLENEFIKCDCGKLFKGNEFKEDTCPKCLKELINPKEQELLKDTNKILQKIERQQND